jgi:fluoride exporter
MTYLWVAVGSALGGVVRHWCTGVAARLFGEAFPWGTIIVNLVGSFVIGVFATLTAHEGRFAASSDARAFVMAGLCGGYTTFSAFSLQSLELARAGAWAALGLNVGLSVALCLVAVWLGHVLAVALNG